jgi:hypothetical protein
MTDERNDVTIADLDARMKEIEAVQAMIIGMLSTIKPLDRVLEQYGATETQSRAFYQLIDDLASRASTDDYRNRPSFAYFEMQMNEIFPGLRNNREFIQLILDMLAMERPAYRELHKYTKAQGWPRWR